MAGAIWNTTRSLADTAPLDGHRRVALARREANARDRDRVQFEHGQLDWAPAPGRAPFAGQDDELIATNLLDTGNASPNN